MHDTVLWAKTGNNWQPTWRQSSPLLVHCDSQPLTLRLSVCSCVVSGAYTNLVKLQVQRQEEKEEEEALVEEVVTTGTPVTKDNLEIKKAGSFRIRQTKSHEFQDADRVSGTVVLPGQVG